MDAPESSESTPLFHFVEKPGPHSVGLQVVEQYDYSRIFRHLTDELGHPSTRERARPLQTLIWYPAQSSAARPMTVRDYLELWATETNFGRPRMSTRSTEWRRAMSPTLEKRLWAARDALPISGRFPVVVYAPGFSHVAWDNADLCEYLASHGYLVIASPSMGAMTRNMSMDLAGIDAQARDVSFLIGYARTLPGADLSKIAVAGFSWGGISNLFAAARDNRIRALVCLDGSLLYWPGLVERAGDVHPDQMTIPLLSFAQGGWTPEEQARYLSYAPDEAPNVLNAWAHGDLINVRLLGMTHREYSSMLQRNEDVWKDFHNRDFPDRQKADYGREYGLPGYGWMALYTRQFLDAYLKQDSAALNFLKRTPACNGAPKHFMTVDYRTGAGTPPSFTGLRAEIGRLGFSCLEEIHAKMQQANSQLMLDEGALGEWVRELAEEARLDEALALAKLNVSLHPDSGGAHMDLAEIQQQLGLIQAALDSYREAAQASGFNMQARRRLQELESGGLRATISA